MSAEVTFAGSSKGLLQGHYCVGLQAVPIGNFFGLQALFLRGVHAFLPWRCVLLRKVLFYIAIELTTFDPLMDVREIP